MRVLDMNTNCSTNNVLLLLTTSEVIELIGDLKQLIVEVPNSSHHHINDAEYQHEITISVYDVEGDLSCYNNRVKQLILEDE